MMFMLGQIVKNVITVFGISRKHWEIIIIIISKVT